MRRAVWWRPRYSGAMATTIYCETAGSGPPLVFIHAGVADSRQWNNEFRDFSANFCVIRYDMRGYGKSEPLAGKFTHLQDLVDVLDRLDINEPAILVGCSMGGSTALDCALEYPDRVRALVLVDSAPSGLEVDLPVPPKFALAQEAAQAGDLARVAEIETQIWFDGDRATEQVDQAMRELALAMNSKALEHALKELGECGPNTSSPAVERLHELKLPVLAIIGENDIPYMHAAVDVLATKVANFQKVEIKNAAHLPNMDQPKVFRQALMAFVQSLR